MALSCSRFFRFLRSIAEPTIVLVCFSTLLTFVFVLYQPSPGPGISQRVGWQSWDSVGGTPSQGGATQEPPPSDSDWWNVTSPQDDGSSYPLDTWTPLLPHDTGCTYVAPLWFIGDALTLVCLQCRRSPSRGAWCLRLWSATCVHPIPPSSKTPSRANGSASNVI